MKKKSLNKTETKKIDNAVNYFIENRHLFKIFVQGLVSGIRETQELASYIHFLKYRIKNPEHLRKKLTKKALENGGKTKITKENLFTTVNDLAGVRILHLHTEQMFEINKIILQMLEEQEYPILKGPTAICWDREYEALFKEYGITTEPRESMYTSVHYIIEANQKTKITAEIQVRTLMDEVWGEVSHRIDYPEPSSNRACQDQLKVLARLTSGCTRLVDSIFKSNAE